MKHPIEVTLEVVCGKWKALILWHLKDGTLRFGELKRTMPEVSRKMLTQQLRELEGDGLVNRHVYKEVPPRVEYSLTQYGKDLEPTLQTLFNWGKEHIGLIEDDKSLS